MNLYYLALLYFKHMPMALRYTKLMMWLLAAFVVVDLGQAFLQYYHSPMDGDMVILALPAEYAGEIFSNPTGLKAVLTGEPMGAVGRFTAQYSLHLFYHHVPSWLQAFVSPIDSIYLATALFSLLCHILFLYLMGRMVTRRRNPLARENILVYAITTPLLAFYQYYIVQGLIDRSPTYTFYYIWPILIIMAVLIPIVHTIFYDEEKGFGWLGFILSLIVVIVWSQGGPLIPPLAIIWGLMLLGAMGYKYIYLRKFSGLNLQQKSHKVYFPAIILIIMILASGWAYFLKKYNPEFISNDALAPLADRFKLLLKGLWIILTIEKGFSLLLLVTGINLIIAHKLVPQYWHRFKYFFFALAIFSLVYLAMLPFGGYRSYRPYIVRYDTLIPVTICLITVFLHTTYTVLNTLASVRLSLFTGMIGILLLFNIYGDLGIQHLETCEKNALKEISASTSDTIFLNSNCNILSWEPITSPYTSHMINDMLRVWNITDRDKLFFSKKPE